MRGDSGSMAAVDPTSSPLGARPRSDSGNTKPRSLTTSEKRNVIKGGSRSSTDGGSSLQASLLAPGGSLTAGESIAESPAGSISMPSPRDTKTVFEGRYLTRLVGDDNRFRTKHVGIANKTSIYTRDFFNTLVDLPWRKLILVFVLWYLLWYLSFAAVYAYLLPHGCIHWDYKDSLQPKG